MVGATAVVRRCSRGAERVGEVNVFSMAVREALGET